MKTFNIQYQESLEKGFYIFLQKTVIQAFDITSAIKIASLNLLKMFSFEIKIEVFINENGIIVLTAKY